MRPGPPRATGPALVALGAAGLIAALLSASVLAGPARSTTQPTAAAATPKVWFAPLPPLPRGPGRPYLGSTDFMRLFTPRAPWRRAATQVGVLKLYGEWVWNASDAQLRQVVQDLRRRRIQLAVEWGPLDATPACGEGIEGFSGIAEGVAMARRIKRAGGRLSFLAFDEPFYYASLYDGPRACHWSASTVADRVLRFMRAVRRVFPEVRFGDIEPLTRPSDVVAYREWITTFRAANSEALAFLHLDPSYALPGWARLALELEAFTRARGIPFGLISFGEPSDPTDLAWLARSQSRFEAYETDAGGRPRHVILQSWQDRPDRVLPEAARSSYTNLVLRYARPRSRLTLELGPDAAGTRTVDGRLVDDRGRALGGAVIHVAATVAVDADGGAPLAAATVETRPDGRFAATLSGLPATGLVVVARFDGSVRLWPAAAARSVGAPLTIVSRGRPASASSSLVEAPPALAFDGDPTTAWNAGSGPPAWLEVTLAGPTRVFEVRLRVAQTPGGPTSHHVRALVDGHGWVSLADLGGATHDDQVLTVRPAHPVDGVRAVRVDTDASPSFVAWREVEVVSGG